MIEKVGLLPAGNHQQVPFAYKMYMKDDEIGKSFFNLRVLHRAKNYHEVGSRACSLSVQASFSGEVTNLPQKKAFSMNVDIEFVGVWFV